MERIVYSLVKCDFCGDFASSTQLFTKIEDARAQMKREYDEELGESREEWRSQCEYCIGDMGAQIRNEVYGDYWLEWSITEHRVKFEE